MPKSTFFGVPAVRRAVESDRLIQITAAGSDSALRTLPWAEPLEQWPELRLAALPRGISRHVVRLVRLSGRVIAVKEIAEPLAFREYKILQRLEELQAAAVKPIGVVTGRQSESGEPLNAALITEHLEFSLPYRALFDSDLSEDTGNRLIDALALLLAQMHLTGFYWGDVSLSNVLFRRDAGAFSAYLVDVETAEMHPQLTTGQRQYDLELARINIIGELMDLQAGGYLEDTVDAIAIGDHLVAQYKLLWELLTAAEVVPAEQRRWKVEERIQRLNDLGFSLGALEVTSEAGGAGIVIQPKVVDVGHYHQQIEKLTGMNVGELQARRMLDDMNTYRAINDLNSVPLEIAAKRWLRDVFDPVVGSIPPEMSGKLEAAQLFHEVLDHRWFLAQQRETNVPMSDVIASYLQNVLPKKRDEALFLDADPLAEN